jgi:chromosome segregation ATPase
LLEVCGDLTDEQVIASNAKLAKLTEILNGRDVDKHRDTIKAQMKKINEEIDKIPVRINETQLGMPDIEGIDRDKLPKDIAVLQKELQAKQQELARVQAGGEIAEKRRQLAEVEAEILRKQNEAKVASDVEVAKKRAELEKTAEEGIGISTRIKELKADIEANARAIQTAETKAVQLRARWKEENAKQFTIEQEDVCPACGQVIPEEQLAEARQKAEEQFNLEKADKLTEINEEGKSLMESVKATKEENKKTQKQIDKLEAELEESRKEYAVIQQEIEKLQQPKAEDINNPTTAGLIAKKAKLEQEVANLELGSQTEAFKVQEEIDELNDDIKALQAVQAKIEQYDKDTARIAELQAQEKVLATEYERLDGELSLCELFVKTKVEATEGNINSKFKFARFKMFNQLVNGGIEDCCETIYNGVPYSSGLNTGHQNIVGTDIINTFAEYYDFYPPIFIDNAEGVTELPETKGQMIRLVKPSAFEDLDKEARDTLIKKYGDYATAKAAYMKKISKLSVEVG